jgi:hypothetical protein
MVDPQELRALLESDAVEMNVDYDAAFKHAVATMGISNQSRCYLTIRNKLTRAQCNLDHTKVEFAALWAQYEVVTQAYEALLDKHKQA